MTTALLLIDIQNDYFPGGAMTLTAPEKAAEQASALLAVFRQKALPIFHVQHVSTRPGATFFAPNTAGVAIHASVSPRAGEQVITKNFPNSFRGTSLLEALRAADVSKLVIGGMMTQLCVDTTVRAAADLGFSCSLAHDACATKDLSFKGRRVSAEDVQLAYLAALEGSFAAVLPAAELCASLADKPA
jgi:nicotinamidase-related amidase